MLLAEAAKDPEEARRLYEQGVQAGERALGEEVFAQEAGYFWGIIETRPYMRARLGLAEVLWELCEQHAAIDHLEEMLRLNPGDNQGVRYLLATWLLIMKDDTALDRLLAQYPDEMRPCRMWGRRRPAVIKRWRWDNRTSHSRHREPYGERAADADLTIHSDQPPMLLYDLTRNMESQP